MEIVIGRIKDDNAVVDKTFEELATLNAVIKQDTSIINPALIFAYDGDVDFNYVYIPIFGRYYFVKDIDILTGNRYSLTCHVDVLMSFKDDLRKETAILDKVEDARLANKFINDGSWETSSIEINQVYTFPDGFGVYPSYVFIAAGGAGNS